MLSQLVMNEGQSEYLQECADALEWESGPPPLPTGFVYFIGAEKGPIKIGYTTNLKERLKRLMSGSPVRLKILASTPASLCDELRYHGMFKKERQRGEWFRRSPAILAEIERLHDIAAKSSKGTHVPWQAREMAIG